LSSNDEFGAFRTAQDRAANFCFDQPSSERSSQPKPARMARLRKSERPSRCVFSRSARLWVSGVHEAACLLSNVGWRARLKATSREHFNPGPLLAPVVDFVLLPLSGVVGQQPDLRKITCDSDVDHGAELWLDVTDSSLGEFDR
jgi:hypothetical protein